MIFKIQVLRPTIYSSSHLISFITPPLVMFGFLVTVSVVFALMSHEVYSLRDNTGTSIPQALQSVSPAIQVVSDDSRQRLVDFTNMIDNLGRRIRMEQFGQAENIDANLFQNLTCCYPDMPYPPAPSNEQYNSTIVSSFAQLGKTLERKGQLGMQHADKQSDLVSSLAQVSHMGFHAMA